MPWPAVACTTSSAVGSRGYSVDERWLVPHFEKMLYDNAQLARVYLHAFQITGETRFERIVRETLDYLAREMLDAEEAFTPLRTRTAKASKASISFGRGPNWTPSLGLTPS